MGSKRRRSRTKEKLGPPRAGTKRAVQGSRRTRLGLVFGVLLLGTAVGVVIWSDSRQGDEALEPAAERYEVSGDIVYVNNRHCAMSDSVIAEKDLGRFESRVTYDGPIKQFRGKTLVFNQCCANCIASFPKKWATERDQIMRKFGLAQAEAN